MDQILVSTITPCFRMKRYLQKFLEDLPKQTMFNNLEVVLDHNEPDDEEISWIKEFQDKYPGRIKHIIVPKVDPIGISMNRCIRESTAGILTIWNVDDLRTPNSIESQYNVLKNSPEIGLVYGNFTIVRSFGVTKGKLVDCSKYPEGEATRSMFHGPFFMFRKSLCYKCGYFDEQLVQGADFDLAVKLSFNTKISMASDLLGYYLNEGLGQSTKPDTLQPVERVVIELRYGIFDKIDYDQMPRTVNYCVARSLEFGEWKKIENYVPNYREVIRARKDMWFSKGLRNYFFKKILLVTSIKSFAKKFVKKYVIN